MMKKQQLAELLAEALNILNDVKAEELTDRQTNGLYELLGKLPEEVRNDWFANWEVKASDLV